MTPIPDDRTVNLDKGNDQEAIPLFGGRPKRERIIGKDDFVDIKILLNATHTVEEFIDKL